MSLAPLLAVSALVLIQTQPTFYAAWEDGREAERRLDFRTALPAYQRAVALRPKPAARVIIYGNNLLQGYYPYTRIARCCLELSQWEAAQAALVQADHQGEPWEERQALAARLKSAQPRVSPLPAPPQPSAATNTPPAPAPVPKPSPVPEAPLIAPPLKPVQPPPTSLPERQPRATPASPGQPAPRANLAPPAGPQATPVPAAAGGIRPPLLWGFAALALLGLAFRLGRRQPRNDDPGLREPQRVGPYQLERLLGRGGFASTYLARRDDGLAPVALKLLHPFRQDDPEFLGRFRQEARLGSLLDHPHIVRLLDQGPEEDTPWLVMEFVEGMRLDTWLKGAGELTLPLVVDLARQMASAMTYAHDQGVIHRDLKPGNVMIVGTQVKIMDFGIARIMDSETLTTTYAFLGTPLYAAPELQLKTQVGPAADRYSFGVMLFELIAGRPPFQGETPFQIMDQHRQAALPDLARLRPATPAALVDLVGRLTRKDPAQRPEDQELLEILAALA